MRRKRLGKRRRRCQNYLRSQRQEITPSSGGEKEEEKERESIGTGGGYGVGDIVGGRVVKEDVQIV